MPNKWSERGGDQRGIPVRVTKDPSSARRPLHLYDGAVPTSRSAAVIVWVAGGARGLAGGGVPARALGPVVKTVRSLLLAKLLLTALAVSSCAFIRNPPAASTPLREARYLRTRDGANLALGLACDAVVGVALRGRSVGAVLGRFGTCAAGAVVQRSVDRGYRESGGLFVISGAYLLELVRLVTAGHP